MFEAALAAGLASAGVDVWLTGPLPTPAVGYLTNACECDAGLMISASHNSYEDNGVKFFTADGNKFTEALENEIERWLSRDLLTVDSAALGTACQVDDAAGRYMEFCKSRVPPECDLRGLRLVLDCANGALYQIAPALFSELGASVHTIGTTPDGININVGCGAGKPALLAAHVRQTGADFGIAFDGDGDRVLMTDGTGQVMDGDDILYLLARHRQITGALGDGMGVVGTEMTGLGLEFALRDAGISFRRAPVGDRHVVACLHELGWPLGGETCGHILLPDLTATSDAILAALQSLSAWLALQPTDRTYVRPWDQLHRADLQVHCERKHLDLRADLRTDPALAPAIEDIKAELGEPCRVFLRKSGTEPIIRVVVEGLDDGLVESSAKHLATAVRNLVRVDATAAMVQPHQRTSSREDSFADSCDSVRVR